MSMVFQGEFAVDRRRPEVYEFLSDPAQFAPLLPGFQEIRGHDSGGYEVTLRVGVPQIRGTVAILLEIQESRPPERASYLGSGAMAGSSIEVTAGFDLKPLADERTAVLWKGEVRILGMLANLAGPLLRPVAERNLQELIEALEKALEVKG